MSLIICGEAISIQNMSDKEGMICMEDREKINYSYRKCMHDIHRYLFQIRNLAINGDNERIISIVNDVEGMIDREQIKVYTRDFLLNSILSEYFYKSKQQNVDFSIHIEDNVDMSFISDSDKISMFGNLLENALEAAGQCPDGGRIDLRVYKGNRHILVIDLKNDYCGTLLRREGRLVSSKDDKNNHGLGLEILSELTAKYGGELVLEGEDEAFRAVLYISSNADFG